MIKITVDARIYDALQKAFPKPANTAHRALAKYISVLEAMLFKSLHFAATPLQRKFDLFAISLQQLANQGGQIGPNKLRVHAWLRDNNFNLVEAVITGSNLTGHGGSTMEAQANIGMEVAEKFVRYSDTGATLSAVNFPEVALPLCTGKHRLLHIHKNIPGVLSAINRIFAGNGINVSAQSLMTNEKVGYLVMDVDADCSTVGLHRLQEIHGTISARVLY